MTTANVPFLKNPLSSHDLARLLLALEEGRINATNAKTVLQTLVSSNRRKDLDDLLLEHAVTSDLGKLQDLAQQVVERLPQEVEKARRGECKLIQRLVGEGMRISGGKADAKRLGEVLRQMLSS